tara:strand:+ start:129 stop:746 length:618 start_codon:yes stop_codon:yes gene_type:complete
VLPGIAHHITQRGNNKQTVFYDDEDHHRYLSLLAHYAPLHRLRILAYCLMPNHVHIVGVPAEENSLAKAIGRTHMQYTIHFQQKYHVHGHLWQSRFYSCPMDEEHTINALAYVELNPVRAGFLTTPWEYPWSSAPPHCTTSVSSAVLNLERWRSRFTTEYWQDFLRSSLGKNDFCETIREYSRSGKPMGNAVFLKRVKEILSKRK